MTKKLPHSEEEVKELAEGHNWRMKLEREKKERTEAERLQAVLEEGTSTAAVEAALNIIRKNKPELLVEVEDGE